MSGSTIVFGNFAYIKNSIARIVNIKYSNAELFS